MYLVEAVDRPWFFGEVEPLSHFYPYNRTSAPTDRSRNRGRRVEPEISLLKPCPKRSWRHDRQSIAEIENT